MAETAAAHPVTYALGYALIHFVWQGATVGLVTAILLAMARRAAPMTRYAIACAGLLALALLPVVTLASAVSRIALTPPGVVPALFLFADFADSGGTATGSPLEMSWLSTFSLLSWSPLIVIAWGVGVLMLSARLLFGWRAVARLRREVASAAADPWLAETAHRLASALGVSSSIALARSAVVDVPAVIGWLRPVIVVPASAFAGLSPFQLEAILAHELAHIRRRVHLVNAMQHVAETLLFYHPAVWWVSGQIRVEREHCCDDIAVTASGTATEYARALTRLEELRHHQAILGVSSAGGSLVSRVRRVLGHPAPARRPGASLVMCAGIAVLALGLGARDVRTTAAAPQDPAPQAAGQSVPPAPDARSATAEAQVLALEETYRRARLANDSATLSRLLDSAFIGVGSSDTVTRNKAESLARWRSLPLGSLTTTTRQVQIEDGAAVVRGTETQTAGSSTVQLRFARAWKLTPGAGWTLVSSIQMPATAPARTSRSSTPAPPPGIGSVAESITITGTPPRPVNGQSSGAGVFRVGQNGVTPPVKIKDVKPQYPPLAKAAGVQGVVFLESIIDPEGNVTNLKVLRSAGEELDQAAIEAVSQWRFTPSLLNGEPVSVLCTMTVNFTLRD